MFNFESFKSFAFKEYPSLAEKEDKFYPSFFSPFRVKISSKDWKQMESFVKAAFSLRGTQVYQEKILKDFPMPLHKHYSVLMSYDFHLSPEGPRLIEVNTNAGFFLGLDLLTRFYAPQFSSPFENARENLLKSFQNEFQLSKGEKLEGKNLAIVDHKIENQDLYCEFLMYRDFFNSHKISAKICDVEELQFKNNQLRIKADTNSSEINFVYNRNTDFYLESESSLPLKEALQVQKITLSPHPVEYALLASKKRMQEWGDPKFWESLGMTQPSQMNACLAPSYKVKDQAPEWIWENRKKLFFKPLESFGSKAAYAGRGISKKVYEHILNHEYLAQELIPAPVFKADDGEEFKYDLRLYVYKDEIHLAGARLYQGQTTNFKTARGGFAPVEIV